MKKGDQRLINVRDRDERKRNETVQSFSFVYLRDCENDGQAGRKRAPLIKTNVERTKTDHRE